MLKICPFSSLQYRLQQRLECFVRQELQNLPPLPQVETGESSWPTPPPLKRSPQPMPDPAWPLCYTSALVPWLTRMSPEQEGWSQRVVTVLPQVAATYFPEIRVEVWQPQGLRFYLSGAAVAEQLQRAAIDRAGEGWTEENWIREKLTAEAVVLQKLAAKTGQGCSLYLVYDRCQRLRALAERQGWLPPSNLEPSQWTEGLGSIWTEDATARSLLLEWVDQHHALHHAPDRLITGIPRLLTLWEQYDRAHAWGNLCHTLSPAQFQGHFWLIAAVKALLKPLSIVFLESFSGA